MEARPAWTTHLGLHLTLHGGTTQTMHKSVYNVSDLPSAPGASQVEDPRGVGGSRREGQDEKDCKDMKIAFRADMRMMDFFYVILILLSCSPGYHFKDKNYPHNAFSTRDDVLFPFLFP